MSFLRFPAVSTLHDQRGVNEGVEHPAVRPARFSSILDCVRRAHAPEERLRQPASAPPMHPILMGRWPNAESYATRDSKQGSFATFWNGRLSRSVSAERGSVDVQTLGARFALYGKPFADTYWVSIIWPFGVALVGTNSHQRLGTLQSRLTPHPGGTFMAVGGTESCHQQTEVIPRRGRATAAAGRCRLPQPRGAL